MASQAGNFSIQEFSDAGAILASGRLYTYGYGTTTSKTAYTDAAGLVPHTYTLDESDNPYIALNARGELPAPLYLTAGSYDLTLKRSDGSTVWTRRADAIGSDLAAGSGSALVGFIQAGTNAVARTAQDKMRESVSVADFSGADSSGAASSSAAFSSAATQVGTGAVTVPPGTWKLSTTPTMGSAQLEVMSGAILTGSGATAIGYTDDAHHQTLHAGTSGSDFATRYIRRTADHTGGTPGFSSAGFRVDSFVGAGAANYEWAFVAKMDSSATGGQNVGGYLQGIKRVSGAPVWGAVIEVIDKSGANPTTGAVALEIDVNGNGTDNNLARIGIDIAFRKEGADPAGADCVGSYGVRIQNNGEANAKVTTGYGFVTGMKADVGFDTSNATMNQAAIKLAVNQNIAFNAGATRLMGHNGTSFLFTNNTGTTYWALNDNESLTANGVQLLGTQRTGWGVPTGLASRATFDTTTVTLPELAQRLRALIDDLATHGLIGA